MVANSSIQSALSVLSDYVFSGVPSNLAYDLLKEGWRRWKKQNWDEFFIDAFKRALQKEKSTLRKYAADDGSITLDTDKLSLILKEDLRVLPQSTHYSKLIDDDSMARLAYEMSVQNVLIIGGHNLAPEGYAHLVNNLVRHAKSMFQEVVRSDDEGFKRVIQECAEETYSSSEEARVRLQELSDFLDNKFSLVLSSLDLHTSLLDGIKREINNLDRRGYRGSQPLAKQVLRVFISSPNDVADERNIAIKVCDQINNDPLLNRLVKLEVVCWDRPRGKIPKTANARTLEKVNRLLRRPSECDIVVLLLWAQIDLATNPFIDKKDQIESLTMWSFEDALHASLENRGRPQILLYRCTRQPTISLNEPDLQEKIEQSQLVKSFFEKNDLEEGTISGFNSFTTPNDFKHKFENHIKQLITTMLKDEMPPLKESPAIDKPKEGVIKSLKASPFPGLRPFTNKDSQIFFGRDKEIDEVVNLLKRNKFVAVVGASGSGKSSLVWAGVIPRFEEDYITLRFTPGEIGDDPFTALSVQLKPYLETKGWNIRNLAGHLSFHPAALDSLCQTFVEEKSGVLFFIDQFEEIFTLVEKDKRDAFFEMLSYLTKSDIIKVVVTIRSDFYPQCLSSANLTDMLTNGHYPLSTPRVGSLYEMITRPAALVGLSIEAGLIQRILDDTGDEPGALALLAYTLDELYQLCKKSNLLSFSDYHNLGGVQGAIGKRAESSFISLNDETQNLLPNVFRELIEVDISGTATRRRVNVKNFASSPKITQFIDAFVTSRLLVTYSLGDEVIVEVAHEALFRSWLRLSSWIEKVQSDLFLLRQMRAAAAQWERSGRKRDYLWLGDIGAEVQAMLERLQPRLDEIEREFSRPERDHLFEEINDETTSPARRSFIGERLSVLGDNRPGVGLRIDSLPDLVLCLVPCGDVVIGDQLLQVDEFYISKYPLTYCQFEPFLSSPNGFKSDEWWDGFPLEYKKQNMDQQNNRHFNHPREKVSWYQAVAYTSWLTSEFKNKSLPLLTQEGKTVDVQDLISKGWCFRLPTEWEFEQAVTGGNKNYIYPWGENWENNRANTSEAVIGRTTAVGMFPLGASPVGAMDLSGNVWEWSLNEYRSLNGISLSSENAKVLRGGSFSRGKDDAKVNVRNFDDPFFRYGSFGFRICFAPEKTWE